MSIFGSTPDWGPIDTIGNVIESTTEKIGGTLGGAKDVLTTTGKGTAQIAKGAAAYATGVPQMEFARWILFGGKPPSYIGPGQTDYEKLQNQYDNGQIVTQQQARDALDKIVGWDDYTKQQAQDIASLRDQGGLTRLVDLVFPQSDPPTPFTPAGDAAFATSSLDSYRDPYEVFDLRLAQYLQDNPDVGTAYLRLTDPMSLLPAIFEQDVNKVSGDNSAKGFDIAGRLKGFLHATFINPFTAPDRVEIALGTAFFNDVPDSFLRYQLAKHTYDLGMSGLLSHAGWGTGVNERDARLEVDKILGQGLSNEEAANALEAWFQGNGNLGMAGMIGDVFGKIVFDPLWLLPLESIGAVAAAPVKKATGAPKLSRLLRLATPAGREIQAETSLRTLVQMPELAYAEKKLALPAKGITSTLFTKLPSSLAASAQIKIGLPATVAMRQMDDAEQIARLLTDLNTAVKTGKVSDLVAERLPGLLEDPDVAAFVAMSKNLDRGLVDDAFIDFLRTDSGILSNIPMEDRISFVREAISHNIHVTASREAQRRLVGQAGGKLIADKLIPYNRGMQGVFSTFSLNNPGFAYLNVVSNFFHVMWNAFTDPITGVKAFTHSFWTEASTALPKGGKYTTWMEGKLAPWGLIPGDVEAFVARQTGARELFDIGGMSSEELAAHFAADSLEGADSAMSILNKAAAAPASHVGQTGRLRDKVAPFIYMTSRIDTASRRAAMIQSLTQQAKIITSASRVSAERLIPDIEKRLVDAGIDPRMSRDIEGYVRDELFGRFIGRRPTVGGVGAALTDADINDIVAKALQNLDDTNTLLGFRSGIGYAEQYVEATRNVTQGEALTVHTNDLRDIAEWMTNDLLPRMGKDLTPDQVSRMLRQKVQEYYDSADIARQLGRMESTVRPGTTYSASLRLTDQGLRQEMVDTVDTLERYLRAQYFGDNTWQKVGETLSPAHRYHEAARQATVQNVEHLQGIKRVYDRFASEQGLAQIAGDTVIPTEYLADLPDALKQVSKTVAAPTEGLAQIPIEGVQTTERAGEAISSFKVGGINVSVSSSTQLPEIMVDIEREAGKASVSELHDVEQAVKKIVNANPGRPVNAMVGQDLADVLVRRGAKELEPGGADVAALIDLTPLGTTPAAGLTISDMWENYWKIRDESWGRFFQEARTLTAGNEPATKAIAALEDDLTKTFKFHRDTIAAVPSRAQELGSLDAAWEEAAKKIQRRFLRSQKRRPGLLNLPPNDPARAVEMLDGQGPLAQEVNDFVEWVIPQLKNDYADLRAGKLTIQESPTQILQQAGEEIKGRLAEVRQVGVANARVATDFAMLNYNNQYGFDQFMKLFYPFSFWPTRQAAHWGVRFARNPGAVGGVIQAMTQPKKYLEQYGYPERLTQRIPVYIPWLSEMMRNMPVVGDRLASADFSPYYFIDPMALLFPYKQFITNNFDDPARRNTPLGRVLDWSENYTPMGVNPFIKIIGAETGLLDKDAWRSYGFQGGPFGVPLTPTAREVGKWFYQGDNTAIDSADQEFYNQRGYFSKGLLGDILGLSPNKFDVYRAERSLWTLATTGKLLPGKSKEEQVQAAWVALDSHQGQAWKNAVKAAESEDFLRQLTSWAGFPAGPVRGVQQGEFIWLGLKAAQAEAARRGELDKFYEKYPEFSVRSAVVKGISDPAEKQKAIDTELYYQSIAQVVDAPYAGQLQKLTDELWRLRGVEQSPAVRDQIDVIETQLDAIHAEQDTLRATVENAYPYRETELSLNRDPEQRALAQLRSQWYDIPYDSSQPYEAFQAAQQNFLDQLPNNVDPVLQESTWHELSKEAILLKFGYGQAINKAIDSNNYDAVGKLTDERDAKLEALHQEAQSIVTQRDFLRYMGGMARRKTPEEKDFDQANAYYDYWMSLVGSGSLLSSREKASVSAYFRSLPIMQKYFPLETVSLSSLTFDQKLAIMKRREFWKTFHAISDPQTQLDYFYMNQPELDAANDTLGIPRVAPIDVPAVPPEYTSDPLVGYVDLMSALNQGSALQQDQAMSDQERAQLAEALSRYGSDSETFGALSPTDAQNYLLDLYGP